MILNRLNPRPSFVWNQFPGGLAYDPTFDPRPSAYPFYHTHSVGAEEEQFTVVITVSRPSVRESSPLNTLIRSLASAAHLREVVIQWVGSGPPRIDVGEPSVPVKVVRSEGRDPVEQFWPLDAVKTDAVLHLSEGVELNSDEVRECVVY